jgi:hypothetical protein
MQNASLLLNNSGYRRRWLFTKALEESVPLAAALELAQAAEEFLMGAAACITAEGLTEEDEATRTSDDREIAVAIGAVDTLSSVVSIDELVRYLEKAGETVVPQSGGKFLIDGCSSENAEGLRGRANRIRARQGLPRFELIPSDDTGPTGEREKSGPAQKLVAKRPPTARERADWARQVMALPT